MLRRLGPKINCNFLGLRGSPLGPVIERLLRLDLKLTSRKRRWRGDAVGREAPQIVAGHPAKVRMDTHVLVY
jgi:hypothetical protein